MSDWKQYPEPQASRTGCKVSWNYYAKKEDAEACAVAAKHNAAIDRARGYDHGYCSPGSSVEGPMKAEQWGEKYAGLYEVCIP